MTEPFQGARPGIDVLIREQDLNENWSAPRSNELELAGMDETAHDTDASGNLGYSIPRVRPAAFRERRLSDDHYTYFARWGADVRAELRRAMRRRGFFRFMEAV
jgi:hypothetical protein